MSNVHFSSKTNEWSTPQEFFDRLNEEFSFSLDAAATKNNAKCSRYYTKSDNGLSKIWDKEIVYCNPPYGREIGKWVKKASLAQGGGSCYVNTSKDRHKVFSRIYIQQEKRRNTFYKRSIKIWRSPKLCSISFNGSNI